MDYEAALHLLTAPPIARWTAPSIREDGFDWDTLMKLETPAPQQARILIGTAYELWESRRAVALWEIPATLDHQGMERVVDALLIGHGRVRGTPDPRHALARAGSPEHAAVAHVLASPRLAARVEPHVHPDGFDWFGLLAAAETMSRGQRLLVDIAHDLWTRGDTVGVREITRSLDSPTFLRVVEALQACRLAFGGTRPQRPAARMRRPAPALAATA
jgi:hypothetical protein